MRCPACQDMSPEGARLCAACGAPLELGGAAGATREAERRQISVMLCDLVGSTALSGRLDPEELAEVIGRYQSRIAPLPGAPLLE